MAYDAAFGENHFFPDLQRLVPTRLAQGAGDEFFADVPFAEATFIHFRQPGGGSRRIVGRIT